MIMLDKLDGKLLFFIYLYVIFFLLIHDKSGKVIFDRMTDLDF